MYPERRLDSKNFEKKSVMFMKITVIMKITDDARRAINIYSNGK